MKPPKKPFIVEIKHARRARTKPPRSIWAAVDLRATADDPTPGAVGTSPLKLSPKPVAPSDATEPPKAQRILPALARSLDQDLKEISSIDRSLSEHKSDTGEVDEASVGSNALATEPGEMARDAPKPRLRYGNDETLPAGQRWKRRLPRILR